MSELVPIELIASKIYLIRGIKVMLDRDLAELYGVETKRLKEQVRRNIERFPQDFMFELTKDEYQALRSQIATLKRGQHSKYAPFAFTEHGVLMLSSVLKSERAVQVNIQIMRTFTKLREALLDNKDLRKELEELKQLTEERFQVVFETLDQLLTVESKPKKKIGYTVKEKQEAYVKKAKKKKKLPVNGSFTPKAKKIWGAIPGDIQFKILNNVWCVHCRKESSIGNLTGKIESGMLVLRGTCTKCGGEVARVIENE
jgi:phage regulator Rha-like protein